MGILENEIETLMELRKKFRAGETSLEQANLEVSISSAITGNLRVRVAIEKLAIQSSKSFKRMVNANIVSETAAIPIDEGMEHIKCPEQGYRCISREDCLDYSGESRHIDVCQKCAEFGTTRKYCL